ncbi:hypothetical protein [Thermus thermamylovorans]|uniref:Uncharacterized protein n=1 Tax=Thermus thermamylovorans TaxID=2509362 RepID=A0A4Q9B7X7_9DEIN|nr:hypothetical protein [Thermus thermamylovorans]TBH21263.1 hypothetical protein ETP66_03885 [Thermus thermamylovorans]
MPGPWGFLLGLALLALAFSPERARADVEALAGVWGAPWRWGAVRALLGSPEARLEGPMVAVPGPGLPEGYKGLTVQGVFLEVRTRTEEIWG